MERTKGSFYKVLTVASEDGTSCSNSHHAPERTSDVDGCTGVRPENNTAVQTTDPGPLCKAVGATNHTEYDRYPDDVIQDKKLQPESTYQNDRIEVETVDGGVIDLEDCPVLDLSDLSTEHCEWPELKCEGHSSLAERKEITASEPFIDIHSLEQDSGMKQNIEDCIIERNNQINLTSPISQSLLSESHFHNSLTSPDSSLDMIHSTFESGGHRSIQLDLESFEPKNYMLSSETESIRPLSSCCGVYQCEDSWINGTLSMSDSGQNASDISFGSSSNLSDVSHQDRFKDVFQKEFKPDSGFLMNFDFHLSLSNSCYNSGIISGDRSFLKSPGEELIKDIEDNTKGEDEDDFNKEATDDQTFFESPKKSKESRKRYLYTLVTENSDSCEDQNTSHGQDNTVSGVHHIMFYIIHLRTGQKAVITFHDLEVIQDNPGKTFCTLKSFKLQRGLWLLHHLERLGFLTLHKILPTVGILEPALHGLGGYFQQMEQGQQVTVLDSMQYEWMRVRSFWSFPRNAGVSYLHLARVGFFYTGRVSETRCYSCGKTYREWKEGDDPVEIHRRLSPDCPHLNGREALNRPIYPDINEQWPAIPWEPLQDGAEGPLAEEEPAALVGAELSETETILDERSQHPVEEINIQVETTHDPPSLGRGDDLVSNLEHRDLSRQEMGQDDLSQVETRPAVLDTTPHIIPEAPPAVDPTGASSVSSAEEGKSSRLTEGSTEGSDSADPDRTTQDEGEQEVAPNTQEQAAPRQDQGDEMPRGVPRADPPANYMPRYPLFAVQAKRAESFQNGWPAYLNQTPYEMSSAGFFYSGNGDYCRCFYCGGGLRNWEPGDDPWVEHARWFPQCLYVKQNKGERFVRLVLQRQENNQQNAPPRQEPVLQPPPANQQNPAPVERNQLQGQATSQPNQQSQQRGEQANTIPPTSQHFTSVRQGNIEITESTVDEMSIAAVESLKVNGVSSSRIQQALQIWKSRQKQAYKISNVTSEQLMQIIFEQEDEENRRLTETSEFASALARHSSDSMRGENSHGSGAHFAGITSGNSTGDDPEASEVLSLQNEIEERMKKLMCSVCGENEVTVAFLPCGHLVCCSLCAPAMITCPACREPVKGNVKVFLM